MINVFSRSTNSSKAPADWQPLMTHKGPENRFNFTLPTVAPMELRLTPSNAVGKGSSAVKMIKPPMAAINGEFEVRNA